MIETVLAELAFFIIVSLMLGFNLRKTSFDDYAEEFIIRILYGACLFPILALILGVFGLASPIPIFISAVFLMFASGEASRFKMQAILKDNSILAVIGLSLIMLYAFDVGVSSHIWLEDGDPNGHAVVASYIAKTGTWLKPVDLFVARYIEPYPMGYQLWMGVLSSINGNVNGVLKVFNNLFIVLTIPAFFYLVKRLFNSSNIAMLSSFVLVALPAFSTRFIFAQSLSMLQMVVAFYLIARIVKGEKNLAVYGGLILGSLCLTHQTTAVIMGVLAGLWLVYDRYSSKKLNTAFVLCLVVGVLVATPWWAFEYAKYGWDKIKFQLNLGTLSSKVLGLSDPQMRLYTVSDLINVGGVMDNMTGFGVFAFILLVIVIVSIVYYRDSPYEIWLAFIWLVFCGLALFSNRLPVSFIPSRMWPYTAIPVAILVGNAIYSTYKMEYSAIKSLSYLFVMGILATSMYPKMEFNSSLWPSARFTTPDEYAMAGRLYNLTPGTKVMDLCSYERVWSLNLWDDPTDRDVILFKNSAVNISKYGWDSEGWLKITNVSNSRIFGGNITSAYQFLKDKKYEYIIVGSKCVLYGINQSVFSQKINEMDISPLFGVYFKSGDERVYQLK
jgi:hypothetical protein